MTSLKTAAKETRTSVDEGKARVKDLTRLPVPKSFDHVDLRVPSSIDLPTSIVPIFFTSAKRER